MTAVRLPGSSSRLRAAAPLQAGIVSKSRETLEGLESYLRRAGVQTSSTRRIERTAEIVTQSSALVVFPDDFAWEAVVLALTECRKKNARAVLVLVTRSPRRFEALPWPDGCESPVIVPKPAWGFTILDAIRAHLGSTPPRS